MLGDGLAALTSACESRLALDQIMTESSPLYVPLITSIHLYAKYKMFRAPAPAIKMTVSVDAWQSFDPVLIFSLKSSDVI